MTSSSFIQGLTPTVPLSLWMNMRTSPWRNSEDAERLTTRTPHAHLRVASRSPAIASLTYRQPFGGCAKISASHGHSRHQSRGNSIGFAERFFAATCALFRLTLQRKGYGPSSPWFWFLSCQRGGSRPDTSIVLWGSRATPFAGYGGGPMCSDRISPGFRPDALH